MMTGPWRSTDDGRVELKPPLERSAYRGPLLGPQALETAADRQRIAGRVRILEGLAVVLVVRWAGSSRLSQLSRW